MKTNDYHAGYFNGFLVGSVSGILIVGLILCLVLLANGTPK